MAIKDLVISSKDLLEGTVEQVIQKHFKYSERGEVLIVDKSFLKLTGEEKIQRYLAAAAGRQFLDLEKPETGLDNAQLTKSLNMNNNSVRGFLSKLRVRGLVETIGSKNSITTQGLHDLLEEKEGKNA